MRARADLVRLTHELDLRVGFDQPRAVDGREEVLFRVCISKLPIAELGMQRGERVRSPRERVDDRVWVSREEFVKYGSKMGCISKKFGVVYSLRCIQCRWRRGPHRLQWVFLWDQKVGIIFLVQRVVYEE